MLFKRINSELVKNGIISFPYYRPTPQISICHRMIYLYNLSRKDGPCFLNPCDYPIQPEELMEMMDFIIEAIDISNLSEIFQNLWINDKEEYLSWIRKRLNQIQVIDEILFVN